MRAERETDVCRNLGICDANYQISKKMERRGCLAPGQLGEPIVEVTDRRRDG
jgi:hypothetical protein